MEATQASVFQLSEETVELPDRLRGVPLFVRIRGIDAEVIARAFGALPSFSVEEKSDEPAKLDVSKIDFGAVTKLHRIILEAGIVDPQFSFGGAQEGLADWRAVSLANRAFLLKRVLELSGFNAPKEVENFAGRFRGDGGGEAASRRAGGSLEIVRREAAVALGSDAPAAEAGGVAVRSDDPPLGANGAA